VVQAGTATSWRRRGAPNSFNLIRLDGPDIAIEEWTSDGGPFSSRERGRPPHARNADDSDGRDGGAPPA